VPAFNINNMEQGRLAHHGRRLEPRWRPSSFRASRGARSYANDVMLKHMMDAITEIYPQIPVLRASRSRQRAGHLHDRESRPASPP